MKANLKTPTGFERNAAFSLKPIRGVLVECSVKIDAADIQKLPPENAKALLEGIGLIVATNVTTKE